MSSADRKLLARPGSFRPTAYPLSRPSGVRRSRTWTPAARSRSRNSWGLREAAAACWTSARSQSRAGRVKPVRVARSVSARVVWRAAVRSAGAVDWSPYFECGRLIWPHLVPVSA